MPISMLPRVFGKDAKKGQTLMKIAKEVLDVNRESCNSKREERF